MSKRTDALSTALEIALPRENEAFTGEDASFTFNSGSYLFKYVVGRSLQELVDRLPALFDLCDADGAIQAGALRLQTATPLKPDNARDVLQPPFRFLILDEENAPCFQMTVDREKENVSLHHLDPDDQEYPYPECIARARIMESEGRPVPNAAGTCLLRNFGSFVQAMDLLRPMMDLASERAQPSEDDMLMSGIAEYFSYGPLLEQDGGLAGELCLEVALAIQKAAIGQAMRWARSVLPEAALEMEQRGILWDKSYLNYNDLNNSACAISLGDGRRAMVHVQANLISDYWGWLAVSGPGGGVESQVLSLYAISRSKDHAPEIIRQLQEGTLTRVPEVRYDYASGEIHLAEAIDHTGVAEVFSFNLNWAHEMAVTDPDADEPYHVQLCSFTEPTAFSSVWDEEEDNEHDDVGLTL